MSFAISLLNSLVMNYHQHDGYFVLSWSVLVLVNCSPQLYTIQSMACFKARAAAVQIREHGISTTYVFGKKSCHYHVARCHYHSMPQYATVCHSMPRCHYHSIMAVSWYHYRIPSIESRFHSKFIFQKHGKSFV